MKLTLIHLLVVGAWAGAFSVACVDAIGYADENTDSAPVTQKPSCVPHFENGVPAGETCMDPSAGQNYDRLEIKFESREPITHPEDGTT